MDVLNSVRQCFVQIPVWSLSIRKSYLEVISGWAALVAALTRGKLSWSGNILSAWDANVGRAPLTLVTIIQTGLWLVSADQGPPLWPTACVSPDVWRHVAGDDTCRVLCVTLMGARVTRVTDHTQDGLTAGYQLALRGRDAKDSRAGRVSGASRRTVSSPSRSCPRLSPRHLNYRQSRTRGHTGSVSVLVTCSSYSQSYGGYLKIAICVQFRTINIVLQ